MVNRYLALALALVASPLLALAQASEVLQQRGGHLSLVGPSTTPGSVKIIAQGSNPIELYANGVKVAESDPTAGGFRANAPAYVPTLAATPVAGTNDFRLGVNVVPTAAANTAALLPTPAAAGQRVTIVNSMANAVRIKAGGTNTISGSAAGAYIPSAAASITDCESTSTTGWFCGSRAVPTPAGP